MNERIQELEKQCWGYRIDGVLVDGQLHFDTEKYARLIITECASKCVNVYDAQSIKQHFGVEE